MRTWHTTIVTACLTKWWSKMIDLCIPCGLFILPRVLVKCAFWHGEVGETRMISLYLFYLSIISRYLITFLCFIVVGQCRWGMWHWSHIKGFRLIHKLNPSFAFPLILLKRQFMDPLSFMSPLHAMLNQRSLWSDSFQVLPAWWILE